MSTSTPQPASREPTTSIDWPNLGFAYVQTRSHIKYTWRSGTWDEGVLVKNSSAITMDIAATALNYGQNCFEGLKLSRMRLSCSTASMPEPPEHIFLEAVRRVVLDNIDFVPPQTSNGSLYIRPLVLGTGPQIGLSPAEEVTLIVYVVPVGDYYKGGMGQPVKALVAGDFDRAAPRGTGHVKLGGNYAPVFGATAAAKKKGYTVNLFLDARTGTQIEEDGQGWVYVTPRSSSILAGITNRSLAELASRKFGWKIERREVLWDEVKEGKFEEVAACGTAVVITPIGEIHREESRSGDCSTLRLGLDEDLEGKVEDFELEVVDVGGKTTFEGFRTLYKAYRDLQTGNLEGWEEFGWMWPAEGI
ncbi:aminotransferase [Chytridium lagenaria]|nr:aminotransferase [Chytridium lagenaria]